MLAIELQGLIDAEFEIETTGFSLGEVEIILHEASDSAPVGADSSEVDVIPAYRQDRPPVTKPGDLWVLGRHKLLCGDARDEKGYSRNGGSHFHGFAVQRAHRWSCLRL
jgi:hypothetical protein